MLNIGNGRVDGNEGIATILLEAERKMGKMLKTKDPGYKPGPGRGIKGGNVGEPPFNTSTLKDLHLTKRESAEAVREAGAK